MQLDYKSLLKKAMEKMPEKALGKERFKIPQVFHEIRGNRTYLKNFQEILNLLRREPNQVSKFLFKELATSGYVEGTSLVFQGKINREILQRKVESYIKEFVICKVCGNPDTKLVKEGRFLFMKCEACGAKNLVRS